MLSMKHHLPYIIHYFTIINKTILFFNPKAPKEKLKILAIKFLVLALVLITVIPFSLKLGDLIYEVNRAQIEQVTADLDETTQAEEDQSWLSKMLDSVKESASAAGEKAKQILPKGNDKVIPINYL